MSTTLIEGPPLYFTRFWRNDGEAYQITTKNGDFVQLTQRELVQIITTYLEAKVNV